MSWAQGRDLYNRGLFWEAHEAWEPLWLASRDPVLRGWIQAAATLLKVREGNLRGAQRNWAKARRNLLETQRAELERYLAPLEEGRLPSWEAFPRLSE